MGKVNISPIYFESTFREQRFFPGKRINGRNSLNIAGCATPIVEFSLVSRWLQKKTSETRRAGATAVPSREFEESSSRSVKWSKKIARRASRSVSLSLAATDRAYRSRSSPHNADQGIISRRGAVRKSIMSRWRSPSGMERNGPARPGPAYPAGGSKRKEAERPSADSRGALSDGTIDIVVEGDNSGRRQR